MGIYILKRKEWVLLHTQKLIYFSKIIGAHSIAKSLCITAQYNIGQVKYNQKMICSTKNVLCKCPYWNRRKLFHLHNKRPDLMTIICVNSNIGYDGHTILQRISFNAFNWCIVNVKLYWKFPMYNVRIALLTKNKIFVWWNLRSDIPFTFFFFFFFLFKCACMFCCENKEKTKWELSNGITFSGYDKLTGTMPNENDGDVYFFGHFCHC